MPTRATSIIERAELHVLVDGRLPDQRVDGWLMRSDRELSRSELSWSQPAALAQPSARAALTSQLRELCRRAAVRLKAEPRLYEVSQC
jgi:hypothetical protein